MKNLQLSQSTIEKLGYYVYLLIDPRDRKVFYVGKGKGSRINQHVLGALRLDLHETEKIKRIKEIRKAGLEVEHWVLRHQLSEKEALDVESAAIDLLTLLKEKTLTNIARGHHSEDLGLMKLEDIKTKYEAKDAVFQEPAILININTLYRRDMNETELYEATRKYWRISPRRAKPIRIACSVYRGIIREVFMIDRWLPSPDSKVRHAFEGKRAPEEIREKYRGASVSKYWKKGNANPIRYASPARTKNK